MLLVVLAMAGLTAFADPVGDGAFVGNVVAARPTSLVVRADNGDDVTFLIDSRTDMPAGFVTGTRVVVRFEILEDHLYRAVSVSPPHLPLEADVSTEMPPSTRPEPLPPSASQPRRTQARPSPSPTPVVETGPPARPRVDSPSAGVAAAPLESLPRRPLPTLSPPDSTAATRETPSREPPRGLPPARLVALTLLLTAALLTWAFLRSR